MSNSRPQIAALAAAGGQVPAYVTTFAAPPATQYCIVIPVINEGERLGRLLARMGALDLPAAADIIVVDGGSRDGSVTTGGLRKHRVSALLVKTGPGRLSAQLRCAYAFALERGYRGVVTIDGNDKDDPGAIAGFLSALDAGIDFVQGSRFVPGGVAEHTPWVREWAIRLIHAPLLSIASGHRWTDTTQGFRAYSRRLLADSRVAPLRDVFMDYELLAYLSYRAPRLGFRCIELATARRYPERGPAPTHIVGLRGNLNLLRTLLRACTGGYNPAAPPATTG